MTQVNRERMEVTLHRMLERAGTLERWHAHFHSNQSDSFLYRRDVNRFLRMQLGMLNEDTREARLCLSDTCDWQQWLKLLERHVMPILAKHQLPSNGVGITSWLIGSR